LRKKLNKTYKNDSKIKHQKMTTLETAITGDLMLELTRETVRILETKHQDLLAIRWTEGEANTDMGFSTLASQCCEQAWTIIRQTNGLLDISIQASAPDINIVFTDSNGYSIRRKIELKSAKGNTMPGSTIGQELDINQPLIYCKRPRANQKNPTFEFCYSQYHTAMLYSDTERFQDRNPRPGLDIRKMTKSDKVIQYQVKERDAYVSRYAVCALNRLDPTFRAQHSWQDDLTQNIINEFLRRTSVEELIRMKNAL
jgi:hypothetical protein